MDDERSNREASRLVSDRKLRIAWSMLWGLACVLVIVLWVRSYSNVYRLEYFDNKFKCATITGSVKCSFPFKQYPGSPLSVDSYPVSEYPDTPYKTVLGFAYVHSTHPLLEFATTIVFPIWLFLIPVGVAAVLPWLYVKPFSGTRFSLGTLLIATSLVAVVLGAIVYAVR